VRPGLFLCRRPSASPQRVSRSFDRLLSVCLVGWMQSRAFPSLLLRQPSSCVRHPNCDAEENQEDQERDLPPQVSGVSLRDS